MCKVDRLGDKWPATVLLEVKFELLTVVVVSKDEPDHIRVLLDRGRTLEVVQPGLVDLLDITLLVHDAGRGDVRQQDDREVILNRALLEVLGDP